MKWQELQVGEVCRIQCHYKPAPESGVSTSVTVPAPVDRKAVVGVEQRPEFVVEKQFRCNRVY